jgi:hypothetical protein
VRPTERRIGKSGGIRREGRGEEIEGAHTLEEYENRRSADDRRSDVLPMGA